MKKVIFVVIAIVLIGLIGAFIPEDEKTTSESEQTVVVSEVEAEKMPSYEVVGSWGEDPKNIYAFIEPSDLDEQEVSEVLNEIDSSECSRSQCNIYLFDDRETLEKQLSYSRDYADFSSAEHDAWQAENGELSAIHTVGFKMFDDSYIEYYPLLREYPELMEEKGIEPILVELN